MASDAILRTYGDNAIREDVVLNAVEILTARETQIFNMLGKTEAIQTIHNYLTDTLRTPSLNQFAVEEAAAYTANANSTPTRLTNIVEILALNFEVSRTQQQVAHYTGQNELARQTQKALMDWANAAEFDLLRSVLSSGTSGTAPKMNKQNKPCSNLKTQLGIKDSKESVNQIKDLFRKASMLDQSIQDGLVADGCIGVNKFYSEMIIPALFAN